MFPGGQPGVGPAPQGRRVVRILVQQFVINPNRLAGFFRAVVQHSQGVPEHRFVRDVVGEKLHILNGRIIFFHSRIDKGPQVDGIHTVGLEDEDLLHIFQGILMVFHCVIGIGPDPQGVQIARLQLNRPGNVLDGLFIVFQLQIDFTANLPGSGNVRIDLNGLVGDFQGLLVLFRIDQFFGQQQQGQRIVSLGFGQLAEIGDGLVRPVLFQINVASQLQGEFVVGIELQRLVQVLQLLFRIVAGLGPQHHGQCLLPRIVRGMLESRSDCRLGRLAVAAGQQIEAGGQQVGLGHVRIQLNRGFQFFQRLLPQELPPPVLGNRKHAIGVQAGIVKAGRSPHLASGLFGGFTQSGVDCLLAQIRHLFIVAGGGRLQFGLDGLVQNVLAILVVLTRRRQ